MHLHSTINMISQNNYMPAGLDGSAAAAPQTKSNLKFKKMVKIYTIKISKICFTIVYPYWHIAHACQVSWESE